jgi:Tfp pilus assembly protein PilO
MTLDLKKLDRTCLVVVVIVTLACAYWVASLGIKARKQIREENEVISRTLKDLNVAETNLQQLKAVLNTTRKELEKSNERIPEAGRFGQFLKQIDVLMKGREIELISLQPLPTVQEKRYTKIPFQLIFKGAFLDIYNLFRDLETMNRLIIMEKVTITRSKIETPCRVDLTASAFER